MSRLIYGSSNVYRHYSKAVFGLELELVRCTKKSLFDVHFTSIGVLPANSLIVTSVLSNFIVDACQGLDEPEVPLFANQQITAHIETLASLLRGSSNSHVYVVPPLRRTTPG